MTSQPLGEAFIPIRATLDQLDKDLAGAKSKVGKALDGISANVKKAGKAAAVGIAAGVVAIGAGIIAIGAQAIPAASDLNESLNATSVVFGDAAGIIQDFGKTTAEVAGLSESSFNQMAAQTGAMLQNYGLDAETAANATVDLGLRAADMASIFNTDVDQAMTAINAAMRGEADPIERFGVSMNAAAVEAKAMALGLADSTGELTDAAKTQARLALLMEQTDAIAGDFVNTSGDLANAARVQSARWENFMAAVGGFFLPLMSTFQTLFMDLAETVMPMVLDALGPISEVVGGIGEAFADFIAVLVEGKSPIEALQVLFFDIATALGMGQIEAALLSMQFVDLLARIQEVAAEVVLFLTPIWEAIAGFVSFQDVLVALGVIILSFIIPTVVSLVASFLPIILTVAAIVAIVALLRNAWEKDWGSIRTNLTAWWQETGKPIFELLKVWLGENIPKAIAVLKNFWENVLQPAIEKVWNWLSTVLIPFIQNTLIPWIATNLTAAIQTLTDFWVDTLQPAIETVWSFIKDDLIPIFESIWELLSGAGTAAIEGITDLWENTLQPALETVSNFLENTLIPMFETVAQTLKEELGPPLEWLADTVLSKVATGFEGIKTAVTAVKSAISGLIAKLKNLELPDWATPGSPTPFETGLVGINKALGNFNKLLDQNGLMGTPSMSLNPSLNPAMAMLGSEGGSGSTSYTANTTVNTSADPLRVLRASRHLDKLAEIPE